MVSVGSIARFIKLEHSIYSLPFVFLGLMLGRHELGHTSLLPLVDTVLILIAAVGARGLAMTLNRLVDQRIDAANPRTAGRHLASGELSPRTAWIIAAVFLLMLVGAAAALNTVVLWLFPLPVVVFFVYPWLKRVTWGCHPWLGLALGLAPAAAWLAVTAAAAPDGLGWGALTDGVWWPQMFLLSLGVLGWVAGFDVIYALLDVGHDRQHGIHSLPADTSVRAAVRVALALHVMSLLCFVGAGLVGALGHWAWWVGVGVVGVMMGVEAWLVRGADETGERGSPDVVGVDMATVQKVFFQLNGGVGLVLLIGGAIALW